MAAAHLDAGGPRVRARLRRARRRLRRRLRRNASRLLFLAILAGFVLLALAQHR